MCMTHQYSKDAQWWLFIKKTHNGSKSLTDAWQTSLWSYCPILLHSYSHWSKAWGLMWRSWNLIFLLYFCYLELLLCADTLPLIHWQLAWLWVTNQATMRMASLEFGLRISSLWKKQQHLTDLEAWAILALKDWHSHPFKQRWCLLRWISWSGLFLWN